MKKYSFILSLMFLSIGLFGCQQTIEEKVNNTPSNTESKEKVNIYEMKSFSEVTKESLIVITDSEEINKIRKAVNDAVQIQGMVDMAEPQYKIEFENETYFIWINEASGTIMNTENTHTAFSLTEQSVKQVNEIITSKLVNKK